MIQDAAERWQRYYDRHIERGEIDLFMTRAEADAYAFEHCILMWRTQNLFPNNPKICAHCGKENKLHVTVPFGGKAWLHPMCWPEWNAERGVRANSELNGIIKRIV